MSDELERIRRFKVQEPPAPAAVVEAARKQLLEAIASAPGEPPARTRAPGQRRARRPWRHWRVPVVVAGGCAAVLVVLALGNGSTAPTSALAATLERLAQLAAAHSPVTAPRPGQFLYVDSVELTE
jgi:hypothetical protein